MPNIQCNGQSTTFWGRLAEELLQRYQLINILVEWLCDGILTEVVSDVGVK